MGFQKVLEALSSLVSLRLPTVFDRMQHFQPGLGRSGCWPCTESTAVWTVAYFLVDLSQPARLPKLPTPVQQQFGEQTEKETRNNARTSYVDTLTRDQTHDRTPQAAGAAAAAAATTTAAV